MLYTNGRVPEHMLVYDRHGNPWFKGTYQKWIRFQARIHELVGVWLYVSPKANGAYNTYRSFDGQGNLKRYYTSIGRPLQSAFPGRSSHGGLWSGETNQRYGLPRFVKDVESGAFDVANISEVPWDVVQQVANEVGLLVDVVVPRELWHVVDLEPHKVTTPPAPPKPKEIRVKHYHYEDKDARAAGRSIEPGAGFYLHIKAGQKRSQASNVVGGIGEYSITVHLYATGTPGDVVELKLLRQDTKAVPPVNSPHYTERVVLDAAGIAKRSVEFKMDIPRGFAVYARAETPASNKGAVKIAVFDTDAHLYAAL